MSPSCKASARSVAIGAAALIAPAAVFAHGGTTTGMAGLTAGILHPLTGPDHLLAMLAVGLWASQLRGRAAWLMPALFPALMALGAAIALAGVGLPLVEPMIALSVIALGAAVMFGMRLPLVASTAMIGVFALAHGHAHGSELPPGSDAAGYAVGFVGVTVVLHLTGLLVGMLGQRRSGGLVTRVAGSAIAASGVGLFLA